MMHDPDPAGFITKFLERVNKLYNFVNADKNDRKAIIQYVLKMRSWLVSDRSIQEHKLCQAYMTYLWQSYNEGEDREDFVDNIKLQVGYCKTKVTDAEIDGQKVRFKKYKPLSLSFGKCTEKTHNKFLTKLIDYASKTWSVDFEAWRKEYEEHEHLLQ